MRSIRASPFPTPKADRLGTHCSVTSSGRVLGDRYIKSKLLHNNQLEHGRTNGGYLDLNDYDSQYNVTPEQIKNCKLAS